MGPRSWRRHGQRRSARRSRRFRLRRRRRRVRSDRLPRRRRALCVYRVARVLPNVARGQPLRLARCDRLAGAVWAPGCDQHGFEPASDPDQRHDIAISVLRRVVDAGAWARDGDDARADAAPARRRGTVSLPFVLAAGGTGGHLFPAEALAAELIGRGNTVHLISDARAEAFAPDPGIETHQVRAGRFGGGPAHAAHALGELALGTLQARRLLRRLTPACVIGFGGYPSVPAMLAAVYLGLPTLIHEQNAVLGRANRLLASRARRIATAFPATAGMRSADRARAVHTGNPVRPSVLAVGQTKYKAPQRGGTIEVVILGGSQGARIMSEVLPPALAALPTRLREGLRISHQARPEDLPAADAIYRNNRIAAELQSFFTDVPERLARAHLVI